MKTSEIIRCGLLLMLAATAALARDPNANITIRTLMISKHPGKEAAPIYVAGQVVTALRFEKEIDPTKTSLLFEKGRFEPLLVGSKKVVLEPIRDLESGELVPLHVTLVDGTEFSFLVRCPYREDWGHVDHQVNVFEDPDSCNAVLSGLDDSLKRERKLSEEVERYKKEENSVDHALATLLANGQVKKTPFRRASYWRAKNEDMDVDVEVLSGVGKVAVVFYLKNTYYGGPWKYESATLTRDLYDRTSLPFALRQERPEIVPGQSGRLAVVADKSAFETTKGKLDDLVLQVFRDDGNIQVMVTLDHRLLQQ